MLNAALIATIFIWIKLALFSEISVRSRVSHCFFVLGLFAFSAYAEGSKELNANGGNRAYLLSSNVLTASNPFPTLGVMKVYAKVGESLYLGSSAQGIAGGTINVLTPNGSAYASSNNSTTVGLISNRTQEVNGPRIVAGDATRYRPFIVPITQSGVYEINFISPDITAISADPPEILVNANWAQANNSVFISAFDVSVRNAGGTFIPGRTYTNIFGGNLGSFTAKFNGHFKILTKDGYIYDVNTNGQAGFGFAFFVNNKGFRTGTGAASYQSVITSSSTPIVVPPVQDPRANDSGSDITHKIFFNNPASDLPVSDPISGTWLKTTPISPASNLTFEGIEGTPNKAGTYPLGSVFKFDSNIITDYTMFLDVDKNGSFTDPIDVKFTGTTLIGNNVRSWNGLDGLGNPVGNILFTPSNIQVILKGGEVHFPFIDVENNADGIILTRTNGGAPNDIVYWNDSDIGGNDYSVNGAVSSINGHKWSSDFGNTRGVDTWSYILSAPLFPSSNIEIQEADLAITSITKSNTVFCFGQPATYTVSVKNKGPHSVTGAKFRFIFPSELTGIITSTAISGAGSASITSNVLASNQYDVGLNMDNGSIVTFTITGTITTRPASNSITINASILRPADSTDPDATNPDSAPPTDPSSECNSLPSGLGCNNVFDDSTPVPLIPTPSITVN